MSPSAAKAHSLGSYQVIRKLGSGGMAEVFLATQSMAADVERRVVIKAILPHLADDEHFVEMFMREAQVAALLSHPNIVHIHDVSVIEARPCIIMEFLRGRDLWHLLRRTATLGERIDPTAAAAIVAQAASGLDYAHRKRDEKARPLRLVHRDVSPHNLFVTREGHVRVLDFGVAKSSYQQQRTQSGVLKGKLPYMAPEQARSGDVDGRADQFSLGVVLWECLTADRLFARDDPFQTMNALFELEVDPPSARVSGIPEELDRICMKCLEREPADRFGTAAELASALRTWLRTASRREETAVVAAALEHGIPVAEDVEFYGFDVSSTAPILDLPVHRRIGEIEDEETVLRPQNEGTPSTSGVARTPSSRGHRSGPEPLTDPLATAPTPSPLLLAGTAIGAATLMALVVGVVLALAFGDSPEGQAPQEAAPAATVAPPPSNVSPVEIEIRFKRVPEDAIVEVNGLVLEGRELRTVASSETRSIRVLRDGRQLWRYDAVFTESREVLVPDLTERVPAAPAETRPAEPPTARMTRPRSTPMVRRLGTGIELDYP